MDGRQQAMRRGAVGDTASARPLLGSRRTRPPPRRGTSRMARHLRKGLLRATLPRPPTGETERGWTATVEAGSVGDCYAVSVPTHTYTSVGTYPFSYTVHDIKKPDWITRLAPRSSTSGARSQAYWAALRLARSSPPSERLWSGVVGEFKLRRHRELVLPIRRTDRMG